MKFSRIWAIALRIFYLMRGSPARILPLFTLAHGVSACNNTYWPEIYDNMSIVYPPTHYPYSYDSGATRFGDVPTFDPQLFASPAESAGALWEGKPLAKYTAMDVAVWLETCVGQSRAAVRAAQAVDAASRPAVRRLLIDAESQAGLGAFFAARVVDQHLLPVYVGEALHIELGDETGAEHGNTNILHGISCYSYKWRRDCR